MTFRKRLQYFIVKTLRVSNKEAVQCILNGKVKVNGELSSPNYLFHPEDEIVFETKVIKPAHIFRYIAYHKPVGVESTLNTDINQNLVQALGIDEHLFPVGRLDKASEGLLLLTNNGQIFDKILRENQEKEKEYDVVLNLPLNDELVYALRNGMVIMGKMTKPAQVTPTSTTSFTIILTQGLNRQIRRMCYKFGYEVLVLKRTRIVTILLGDLAVGTWRNLRTEEVKELVRVVEPSIAEMDFND